MTPAAWRRRAPAAMAALGTVLLLSGCGSAPRHYAESRPVSGHPRYTVAPYQVNGVWYYPKVDYDYDRTGTASWYGPQFDQRLTADGEVFDMNRVSAAHKTLPLPSVVEVTNLDNGRSLELRVNDRGPFVGDRLIDVSRRAAQLLGFETAGTAPVRVRVLKDQSIQVAEAAMRGEAAPVLAAAAAPAAPPPPAAPVRVAALPPPPAMRPPVPIQRPSVPPAPPSLAENPPPVAVQAAPIRPAENRPPPAVEPPPTVAEPTRLAENRPPTAIELRPAIATPTRRAPALSPRNFANRIEAALFPPAAAATYEPAPRARPAPIAAAAPAGRIFVQAGAFTLRDNAERVQVRVALLGPARVTAARVNGAELYRVRIGPLPSVKAANALLARVVGSGYAGARIVEE
jgi:rare lipoprotein A